MRLGITPSVEEIARLLLWLVATIVYVGFWLAFATLCSVVLRRAATSALVCVAAWLLFTLFFGLLVGLVADTLAPAGEGSTRDRVIANAEWEQRLARMSPDRVYDEATGALLDPEVRTIGFLLPEQVDRAVRAELTLQQSLLLAWPQAVGLVALTVACFGVAYVVFMRQEIRA